MRITKLSLTNFRSFSTKQTIEFAPLTLLFGPNSVGKSSVLMALFYLHHIIGKGNCNPLRLEALDNKYIGGFKNLVHGRQLDKSIIIRVEFDKQGQVGSGYGFLSDLIEGVELGISSPSVAAESMALEFEISWSKAADAAYISRYTVSFDGQDLAEVTSDAGLKQPVISALNYLHPLLLPENHDDWLLECFDFKSPIHEDLFDTLCELKGIHVPSHREITQGADRPFENDEDALEISSTAYTSEFHELINEGRITTTDVIAGVNYICFAGHELTHVPIGIKGFAGALLEQGKKLNAAFTIDNGTLNELVIELFSDLLVAPLDNLKRILDDSLCIGPIREIPDALRQPNSDIQRKDWYNGIAAWDVLANNDFNVLKAVNSWISDDSKLGLGIELVMEAHINYSVREKINSGMRFQDVHQRLVNERSKVANKDFANFDNIEWKWSNNLWDTKRQITVSAADLGVGVSQLMPVIVAALSRSKGIVAVEQPELHIHPKLQVAIGDLLTQLKSAPSFLIETHSEHLILRLLRRIRESNEGTLPNDLQQIQPNDISVIFLSNETDGVSARRICITDDGDFSEEWPGGFFDERDEELF
ncbi:DUF3696 domain-containing protein [Neptunicella sp.]|uniref:DUF3696 domain-containing protein n=1 Tax=Neptunicella sp. TaxID=2125986 RepID=UPI003F692BFA